MPPTTLLRTWLTSHATQAERRSAESSAELAKIADKSGPYARALAGIAAAHAQAAEVYRRALAGLGSEERATPKPAVKPTSKAVSNTTTRTTQ